MPTAPKIIEYAEGGGDGFIVLHFNLPIGSTDGFDPAHVKVGIDTPTQPCTSIESVEDRAITLGYATPLGPGLGRYSIRIQAYSPIEGMTFITNTEESGEII